MTAQYVFNWIRTCAMSSGLNFPRTLNQLEQQDRSLCTYIHGVVSSVAGLKLYESTGNSLRSAGCNGACEPGLESLVGPSCCAACAALHKYQSQL